MRPHRDEIVRRVREKVEYIADRHVMLVHENEKGDLRREGRECLDLMKPVESPKFRTRVRLRQLRHGRRRPLDNWPVLKPYTRPHPHQGRPDGGRGKIVPAGEGDGDIGPILADAYASGYRGFVTMEPHLAIAGQMGGFSGADLFKRAADALKKVCREHDVPLAAQTDRNATPRASGTIRFTC